MPEVKGMIAVLAGSREQFEHWAKHNPAQAGKRIGSEFQYAFYAHDVYSIEGRYVSEIVRVGYWDRQRNLDQLEDMLLHCVIAFQLAKQRGVGHCG